MPRTKSNSALHYQPDLFSLTPTPLPDWLIFSPNSTDSQLQQFIADWRQARTFALDIETYSTTDTIDGALDPWLGEIRLIQIGLSDDRVAVFDLGGYHDDRKAMQARLTRVGFFDALTATVSSKTQTTVGHNLQFDLAWLIYKYSITPWRVCDTMLMSQVYWAGIQTYRHSLKAVAERIGIEVDKTEQKSNFGFPLRDSQILYAANDVRILNEILRRLMTECINNGLKTALKSEFDALPAFAEMMVYGMPVDEGILDDIAVAYDAAYETVVKDFAAVYPEYSIHETAKSRADGRPDGNLIKALGRRSQVYTTKVDKEALNPYRHKPEISSLLTAKSVKTYCDYIHSVKASLRDGAVRGGYRQCAPQGRGRSTSGKGNIPSVNLQNPPNPSKACDEIKALKLPQVRSMFRAPAGYALGSTDYSAAHARIAAQTTQDEAFIASYVSNEDIHCHVASKLSELPKRNWSPEQISQYRKGKDDLAVLATQLRNIAKNEFYGWLNGAGAAKAADTATTGGFPATFDFGKEILHKLGSSFPGIKAFHDRVKHEIRTKIYKIDGVKIPYTRVRAICGRWVWLPVWPKDEGTGYGGAKLTDALIAHWMLTEATAIKLAMGKVRILSEQHPEWGVRIINLAHDELVWICLEPYFYTVHAAMEETMNSTMALFVTDIPVHEGYDPPSEVTYDWAAAH